MGRCICPVPDCGSRIPAAAQQLLSAEQQERYQRLAAHSYADSSVMLQWCAFEALWWLLDGVSANILL